jgi:oxygen-independent coproporphyrinogen-3 oxidase
MDDLKEILLRHCAPGPRYTSYPPATAFGPGFGVQDLVQHLQIAGLEDRPLSLYVHIPFCRKRCAFCGCNVIATRKTQAALTYLEALEAEIGLVAKALGSRRRVDRVHLGGGTPTYLEEPELRRLWAALSRHFDIDRNGELAIEVDPRATTEGQLELLRGLGFSRLSFGVQDLDPEVQLQIGRIQPLDLVRRQLDLASSLGYSSLNFDLLYGLPGQSPESLAATLDAVLKMRPDRIAIYGFAYMPERFAHQRAIVPANVPGARERVELQLLAYEKLVAGGYRPVGFDHFALPGDELCRALDEKRLRRTFMGYTAWPASDLVGLGISSIGEVQGAFSQNVHKLSRYLESISEGVLPVERGYRKDAEDELRGEIIERLLCLMEADLEEVAQRHGRTAEAFSTELADLRRLQAEGLAEIRGAVVRITEPGRFVARNIAKVFDHHLRRARELAGAAPRLG